MTEKGLRVLETVIGSCGPHHIAWVVGARDTNLTDDCFDQIAATCREHAVEFHERQRPGSAEADYAVAVSWRWMIDGDIPLIVLHDSLLPRYRGFAPLPNALINGESTVGVTALIATAEYDRGPILGQKSLTVEYPVKIRDVISAIGKRYSELVVEIMDRIIRGEPMVGEPQADEQATYSLWRDEEDYRIAWDADAAVIRRFIDSVGEPYSGASSMLNGGKVRITDSQVEPDVRIEGRRAGKVIFVRDGCPIVVCGSGLLRITALWEDETRRSLLPFTRFRSRFT